MKKRAHRHVRRHRSASRTGQGEHYLVVVRGWMLVVAFALMLGIGAVVGNFINEQLDLAAPTVAGVSIDR